MVSGRTGDAVVEACVMVVNEETLDGVDVDIGSCGIVELEINTDPDRTVLIKFVLDD